MSYRLAVGDGRTHLTGQRLGELRVGLSAWISAGVVAFGSLATLRAHPAMACSWSVSPASLPVRTPAATAVSDAWPSSPPQARRCVYVVMS